MGRLEQRQRQGRGVCGEIRTETETGRGEGVSLGRLEQKQGRGVCGEIETETEGGGVSVGRLEQRQRQGRGCLWGD